MAYTYTLGAVKPWVKDAAYFLGPMFGIRLIYGWAPGQYDHPKGLALDFMTNNLQNGKATGDQLAAYAVANYKELNITYVIWYRRIWTPAKGWHAYSGASDHTDHVHLSFLAVPTSNGLPSASATPGGLVQVGSVPDKVEQIYGVLTRLNNAAGWIQNPDNLKRVGLWSLGSFLVAFGLFRLMGGTTETVKSAAVAVKGVVASGGK